MLISKQEINSSNIDDNNATNYHWDEKVQFFLEKSLSALYLVSLRHVLHHVHKNEFCSKCGRSHVFKLFCTYDLRRYLYGLGKRDPDIKAAYQK